MAHQFLPLQRLKKNRKTVLSIFKSLNTINFMKKITSKDLSLNKETVSGLDQNSSGKGTTAQSYCGTYTFNEDWCKETFHSNCLCMSDNICRTDDDQCESKTCNPSATDGPVCCGPIEQSTPTGVCPLTQGNCPDSLEVICEQTIQGENGNTCVRVTEVCDASDNCVHISIAVEDGYICELMTRDNCEE